jgi:hypothetical protein
VPAQQICPPRYAYSYRIKYRLLFGNKAGLKQQTKSKIDFWMSPMSTGCFLPIKVTGGAHRFGNVG